MLYLSQVLSRPIRDLEGERVATINDIIVRLGMKIIRGLQGWWRAIAAEIFLSPAGASLSSMSRARDSIQTFSI
jgi:hypothetical protein